MAELNLRLADFKARVGLGTRPNRYSVSLGIPGVHDPMEVEVSALSLPESSLTPIRVPFRGRVLKVPGDRIYAPWSFTVYDTANTNRTIDVWEALHGWSDNINTHEENKTFWGPDSLTSVQNWTITHWDLSGDTPLKQITLWHCWPVAVGAIELAAGVMDTMTQFTSTVEYEYFTVNYGI